MAYAINCSDPTVLVMNNFSVQAKLERYARVLGRLAKATGSNREFQEEYKCILNFHPEIVVLIAKVKPF